MWSESSAIMESPALIRRRHAVFHSHTSCIMCCADSLYDGVHRTGEMDVIYRLKRNTDKIQRVTKAQMQCQTLTLSGVEIKFSTELTFLGVVFDNNLTFAVHITWLAGKCFYHLRHLCDMSIPVSSISSYSSLRQHLTATCGISAQAKTFGSHSFAVLVSSIWNTLPGVHYSIIDMDNSAENWSFMFNRVYTTLTVRLCDDNLCYKASTFIKFAYLSSHGWQQNQLNPNFTKLRPCA